jgi:hypothetical protein
VNNTEICLGYNKSMSKDTANRLSAAISRLRTVGTAMALFEKYQ